MEGKKLKCLSDCTKSEIKTSSLKRKCFFCLQTMDELPSDSEVPDVEEIDEDELTFDPVSHGRNIKLENRGRAAQKIKK